MEVQVEGAHDDTFIIRVGLVEADEVPTIQRQHAPCIAACEIEHRLVSQGLARLAKVVEGDNVVAESSECLGRWIGEVLVGKKARHRRYAASFRRICSSTSSRCART